MYRTVTVIYTMKFIFDVQDFSWVQFYGLLNQVLPFPWKCSSSSSVPLPSYVKGSVCRCKWLDQCLYVGPFLLLSFCFRASFLPDFSVPSCICASVYWGELEAVRIKCRCGFFESSNRSAWEKSLKRLQSSFRLHVDRSGDVSGCNNIQRSRCLIVKLKCSFFVSAIVFLYTVHIYRYKKMSLPSTVLLGFFYMNVWMFKDLGIKPCE